MAPGQHVIGGDRCRMHPLWNQAHGKVTNFTWAQVAANLKSVQSRAPPQTTAERSVPRGSDCDAG
jgi:hypothetical protein